MTRRRLPRGSTADLGGQVLLQGEVAYDTTLDKLRIGDGATVGGRVIGASLGGGGGGGGSDRQVPLFVFIGESNSGGFAVNADLTAPQLAARPAVQILNNTSLTFEDLDIGSNNLIGHNGLPTNATHGWENGLATQVEASEMEVDTAYLVKCGQGGSKVIDWVAGGSYMTTATTRIAAAKALLRAGGLIPTTYVWMSIGINDAIAGTPSSTWKSQMLEWFNRVRLACGAYCPIIATYLPATYADYNAALDDIAISDPFFLLVQTSDAALRDSNHWNAAGMALIASRMMDVSVLDVGEGGAYAASAVFAAVGVTGNLVVNQGQWRDLVHVVVNTDGSLSFSGATPAGAVNTVTIDAQTPFTVTMKHPASVVASTTIVTLIDDNAEADYSWDSSQTFLAGVFHFAGDVYAATGFSTSTLTGDAASNSMWLKMVGDGDDVVVSISTNAGVSWTVTYTFTGVLTGKTDVFLKVLGALPAANGTLTVELAQ